MAVKIRLARRGRKKLALYDIVVADARAPRDGRFIAKIGSYNPNTTPATVDVQEQVALRWLLSGAQPTDTVKSLLSDKGILLRKHLQVGVLKGAVSQESADERYNVWLSAKDAKLGRSSDTRLQTQTDQAKARFNAEVKRNENRAEAIRIKNTPPAPEPVAEPVAEQTTEQANTETTQTPAAE